MGRFRSAVSRVFSTATAPSRAAVSFVRSAISGPSPAPGPSGPTGPTSSASPVRSAPTGSTSIQISRPVSAPAPSTSSRGGGGGSLAGQGFSSADPLFNRPGSPFVPIGQPSGGGSTQITTIIPSSSRLPSAVEQRITQSNIPTFSQTPFSITRTSSLPLERPSGQISAAPTTSQQFLGYLKKGRPIAGVQRVLLPRLFAIAARQEREAGIGGQSIFEGITGQRVQQIGFGAAFFTPAGPALAVGTGLEQFTPSGIRESIETGRAVREITGLPIGGLVTAGILGLAGTGVVAGLPIASTQASRALGIERIQTRFVGKEIARISTDEGIVTSRFRTGAITQIKGITGKKNFLSTIESTLTTKQAGRMGLLSTQEIGATAPYPTRSFITGRTAMPKITEFKGEQVGRALVASPFEVPTRPGVPIQITSFQLLGKLKAVDQEEAFSFTSGFGLRVGQDPRLFGVSLSKKVLKDPFGVTSISKGRPTSQLGITYPLEAFEAMPSSQVIGGSNIGGQISKTVSPRTAFQQQLAKGSIERAILGSIAKQQAASFRPLIVPLALKQSMESPRPSIVGGAGITGQFTGQGLYEQTDLGTGLLSISPQISAGRQISYTDVVQPSLSITRTFTGTIGTTIGRQLFPQIPSLSQPQIPGLVQPQPSILLPRFGVPLLPRQGTPLITRLVTPFITPKVPFEIPPFLPLFDFGLGTPFDLEGGKGRRRGRQPKVRTPSILAIELGLTAPTASIGEASGIFTRPILRRRRKKRR